MEPTFNAVVAIAVKSLTVFPLVSLCLAVGVGWLIWLPASIKRRKRKPKAVPNVKVICLANEKGGKQTTRPLKTLAAIVNCTGKTTTIFHCSKTYARANPTKRVLVIDASVFGDLTSSCAGPKADLQQTFQSRGTIEHLATAATLRVGWFAPARSVEDHLVNVKAELSPAAPSNLFLVTNTKGWSAWHAHRAAEAPRPVAVLHPPPTDEELAHVAAYLRDGLASSSEDWVVWLDSDGGELHTLTRFGLMAADTILLPCRTDTASIVRLTALLSTAEALVSSGLSNATIGGAFFNSVVVGANETDPDSICRTFKPKSTATLDSMHIIRDHLVQCAAAYPKVMQPLRTLINEHKTPLFFSAVRNGGAGFARAEAALRDKYESGVKLSPDVEADLAALLELMLK